MSTGRTRWTGLILLAIFALARPATAQTVDLAVSITDTISSNGDSVVLRAATIGGFGQVKVQTLDTYSGTWEVQCAPDGTNYDATYELRMTATDDNTAVVTSIADTVGIWDVQNPGACQAIRVISTAGFAASDTVVVINATSIGGGGGGSGGSATVTQYAEDAVHASGNTGTLGLAVRQDAPTALAAAGDYTPQITDAAGRTHVAAYLVNSDGSEKSLATDTTHDSAASATGPQIQGDCDDTATDAVDEGDAGRVRIDCATRALRVAPMASNTGGGTTLSFISAGATEDEHAVCTGPCTLYSILVTNTNAAVRYLKCENDTAANTAPGTDTPEFRIAVPGATTGAGASHSFPVGANFATALTCWLVTGAADSDVAEVAANDLMVFYTYKQ